jgi:hypothetical protein
MKRARRSTIRRKRSRRNRDTASLAKTFAGEPTLCHVFAANRLFASAIGIEAANWQIRWNRVFHQASDKHERIETLAEVPRFSVQSAAALSVLRLKAATVPRFSIPV